MYAVRELDMPGLYHPDLILQGGPQQRRDLQAWVHYVTPLIATCSID